MACVGTLSWSVAGLGSWTEPARRGVGRGKEASAGRVAARQAYAGDATGSGRAGDQGRGQQTTRGEAARQSEATRAMRGEVKPLEVDWSQTVQRCMDGDSGAWAELVRTHHRRVYGLCYRFTGSPADAEDLTQDVFLKIYSNLSSFDTTRGSLQVWITTMTRNLLVDNFRRTKNQRATGSLDDGWDQTEELKPIDRLVSRSPSPHETPARKDW